MYTCFFPFSNPIGPSLPAGPRQWRENHERQRADIAYEDSPTEEDEQVSLHLSQLLYCHFGSTIDIVDEKRIKAFKILTQSKYLPVIHRDVAISLLDLERTIVIPPSYSELRFLSF